MKCLLESYGIEILGYIVSDGELKKDMDKNVWYISEIEKNKQCDIVLGMNAFNQREVCKSNNTREWICVENDVLSFLRDYFI